MKQAEETLTIACARCHKPQPASEFYFLKSQQKYDYYCRTCRKWHNTYRGMRHDAGLRPPRRARISTETDPARRMALILNARRLVRERCERRAKRIKEEEFAREGPRFVKREFAALK